MAAAGGAGQEKQLAPTLLSFFIYNPKLGPKEGEVRAGAAGRGAHARPRSVLAWGAAGPRGGSLGPAAPPRAWASGFPLSGRAAVAGTGSGGYRPVPSACSGAARSRWQGTAAQGALNSGAREAAGGSWSVSDRLLLMP